MCRLDVVLRLLNFSVLKLLQREELPHVREAVGALGQVLCGDDAPALGSAVDELQVDGQSLL